MSPKEMINFQLCAKKLIENNSTGAHDLTFSVMILCFVIHYLCYAPYFIDDKIERQWEEKSKIPQ